MKNKILILILLLSLLFSSTGFVFALEQPEKPILTDSTSNKSIQEYNTKIEEYNEKVDEYNAAASAEYQAAVADTQQKNEAGIKTQEESQKAHDDAIVANEQATVNANHQNEEIDRQNEANQKEVSDWNNAEDAKVVDRQQEITSINSQNEQGQKEVNDYNNTEDQKAIQSKEKRDAAIANNQAIQKHNNEEMAKVEASEQIKAEVEQRNADNIAAVNAHNEIEFEKEAEYNAAVEAIYQAALQVEAERIAQLEAENITIEAANQAERDRVAAEEQANAEEQARVEAVNQFINERNAAALAAYEQDKISVETHNTFVDNVNSKIDTDSSESRGFTNNTTYGAPIDWSDETDENTLKTIQIEKSDNPTGEKIRVINLHLFLDESYPYSPDCYQTYIEDDDFELDEEMTNRAVLTEWETAEIDYDDTVTIFSESTSFAGNIVWLNGKRQWFGANPKPYFFRAIEGYTQGYWMPGGSMLATTATIQDYGYAAGGETYTVQHAEEIAYSSYLYNGQPMVEEITVRTTDKQEPKNIFAIFTYLFTRLAPEPEKEELPTPPELEELEEFVPNEIIPATIQELNEIVPNIITKGDLYEKDLWEPTLETVPEVYVPNLQEEETVPDLYTPQYKTFEPANVPEEYIPVYKSYTAIEHVMPILVDIPTVIIWNLIDNPKEPEYLTHLNPLDLLPNKPTIEESIEEPIEEAVIEEPIEEPIESTSITTNITVADNTPATNITTITPNAIPKTQPKGSWALINLIATILSCICAIILLFIRKKTKEDEPTDEEKKDKRGMIGTKIASVLIGIISIIIFIFTEDMTLPMVYTDKWTIIMILLLIIEIINIFIIRQQSKGEKDNG